MIKKDKQKIMKNKKIILIILGALLVAGGIFAAFNMRSTTPEQQVREAERRVAELDSYGIDVEMRLETYGDLEQEILFLGSGDYDRKNNLFRGDGSMDISMEGLALNLGGGVIYANDNLYGKLTTFPYLALPLAGDQVDYLTENDILIVENLREKADLLIQSMSSEIGIEAMTVSDLLDYSEKLEDELWDREVVYVTEVSDDSHEGEAAKKYVMKVDNEKMADFYLDLINDFDLENLFSDLSEEEREAFLDQFEEELRKDDETEFSVWIQDGYLVKVEMIDEINFEEEVPVNEIDNLGGYPEKMVMEMIFEYRDFNEDFEIEEPEEFITLEDLMEEFQFFPNMNFEDIEGGFDIE